MALNPLIESLENRTLFSSYFVATTGSDSAAGTAIAPWKTLQKAFDSVKAGDNVTVRAGNYAGASRFQLQGTASAPILFKADPGVYVTSNATQETALPVGIELSGYDASSESTYVTLDGFNVNNASNTISGDDSSGFRIRFTDHVTIKNCSATNNGWMGFYTSHNTNLTIANSESAFNNQFVDPTSTARNHGIYVDGTSSYVSLLHNLVHDNNGNGIHANENSNHLTVDGNILYNNGANGGSAINNDGTQYSVFSNNLLYNNKGKGISLYNIDSPNPAVGNTIANNTIIQPGGAAAITILGAAIGTTVENNILSTASGPNIYFDTAADSATTIDYNVLIGSSSQRLQAGVGGDTSMPLSTWRSSYDFDMHSLTATGGQVFENMSSNDFVLLSASPARHLANSSLLTATDVYGQPGYAGDNDVGALRYAIPGDSNFDGKVTADDYGALDANFGSRQGGVSTLAGDFNRDGIVSADDYGTLDANFGQTMK